MTVMTIETLYFCTTKAYQTALLGALGYQFKTVYPSMSQTRPTPRFQPHDARKAYCMKPGQPFTPDFRQRARMAHPCAPEK